MDNPAGRLGRVMKAVATDGTPDDTDAIYGVISRCLGVGREQLTAKTLLAEDLGIDSIDLLAMAVDLEEEFGIVITNQTLYRIRTIGDTILCLDGAIELRRIARQAVSETVTTDERPTR